MRPLKALLAASGFALTLTALFAMAQDDSHDSKAATSAVEITDTHGRKHVVTDYSNGARFVSAGLPFDDNITDDYPKGRKGFWERAKPLKTAIAVELHDPEGQARIRKIALSRGMRDFDVDHAHTVILIPLASLDIITFTQQKPGRYGEARSEIRLAGGQPFNGGGGFWKLYGKEGLGSLGTADFAADFRDIKSIRSLTPSAPFDEDFGFFGATEAPFKVTATDTAGGVIALSKALYCSKRQLTVPDNRNSMFIHYGDEIITTIRFKSDLDVMVGGTSSLSIPSSKLRTITVGKVSHNEHGGYEAKAVLRTGENLDLTITPSEVGIYVPNGIVGASSKGWVWIPWYAVSTLEFDKQ
jgi:hypothetical protein